MASQPRRRHIIFGGTGIEGSSESDAGGAGDEAAGGGWSAWGTREFKTLPSMAIGFGGGGTFSKTSDDGGGSGLGVSSMVECFPVVQGGIERNSSKVKNRGLQHFQPMSSGQPLFDRFR